MTTRTLTDGRGNSYAWSYSYGQPQINHLGSNLADSRAIGAHPTSAILYYNVFLDGDAVRDEEQWLLVRGWKEFRGHPWVTEMEPTGASTRRWYYQGDAGCTPAAGARGSHGLITGDSCFQQLARREFLKGQEHLSERFAAGGAKLHELQRDFFVEPVDYGSAALSGLWRAFSAESERYDRTFEGSGGASVLRQTSSLYDLSLNHNSDGQVYGNLSRETVWLNGAVYRRTQHYYAIAAGANTHIVDRPWATMSWDDQWRTLAYTARFYDGSGSQAGIGTRGMLTRESHFDVPLQASLTNVPVYSRDVTYAYDSWGNRTGLTTYAGAGRAVFNGSVWSFNPPGQGSAARTTTTAYDGTFRAFPTSVTNALGHVESAGYDQRMGTLTSVTDANGQTTSATYDLHGRLLTLVKPGDSATHPTLQWSYLDSLQPVTYHLLWRETAGTPTVRPQMRYYDGLGRLIQTKGESQDGAQNIVVDYRYDGLGRQIQQSVPRYVSESSPAFWYYTATPGSGMLWTTTTYEGLGRVSSVTEPNGAVSRTVYTISGTTHTVHEQINASQHRTQLGYDALGRLTTANQIAGNCGNYWGYSCTATTTPWTHESSTYYAYSPLDQLTRVTDAHGNVTNSTYDSLGRKRTLSDPNMGAWSYSYDANGNLTSQTDGKGQTTTFTYDVLDRQTQRTMGAVSYRTTYDQTSAQWSGYGHGRGRRSAIQTWVSGQWQDERRWGYDARGRITRSHHWNSVERAFTYAYDSADRLSSVTYPSGETVSYSYDAAWRQTGACSSGTVIVGCYAANVTYDARGQLTFVRRGNQAVEWRGYEAATGRLSTLQVGSDSSSGAFFHRSYSYDPVGNLASSTNHHSGQVESFTYDHRERLSSWNLGGVTQSYSYDYLGNLTNKAGVGYQYGSNGNGSGVGPQQARVVGTQSYSYDATGNLLSGGGRSYSWTADHRPASLSSGGVTETYRYDGDGTRISRTRAGQTTVYVTEQWEEVVGGTARAFVLLNGQPIAVTTWQGSVYQNSATYLHGDHLGSVSVATGFGSGGPVLVSQQAFDPWGALRSGGISQTSHSFTGQRRDDTGLLFYNARYYDPAIGRFISADSIVPGSNPLTVWPSDAVASGAWGMRGGGPANPQELNRYSYALNNPVRYTDPTGHMPWILAAAGIGAAINVGAALLTAASTGELQQMSGREIAGMVAGAAVSGAIGGALSAVGGPIISSLVAGTAVRFAGNVALSAVGTAAGELIGSATEGVVNAIYTPKPLQVEPPSLSGAVSDGALGTVMPTIGYEQAESLPQLRQSLQGPSGPRPSAWQGSRLNQYNAVAAATRFNRKAYLANVVISGLVGVGASAMGAVAQQGRRQSGTQNTPQ